jgi:hypothetical protein
VRVSLQMTTRPSPFQGVSAVTADYVASVQANGVTRTTEGHVLDFGDVTVRNAVLDRAAAEIAALLAAP